MLPFLINVWTLSAVLSKQIHFSPKGEYSRIAQIRHLGLAHYLLLTHLHSDHASGLQQVKEAKHILVSEEEWQDTKAHAERYVTSMWKGVNVETFAFAVRRQWHEMM